MGHSTDLEVSNDVDTDSAASPFQQELKGPLEPFRLSLVLSGLYISIFCMGLDNTIIATAIPEITNHFHSLEDVGWYGSSYMLATSAICLPYGRLYTFITNKWVYLTSLCLFELGSLLCGAAPSSVALLVGRAIAGLGAGGLLPGSLLLITQSVSEETRPFWSGLLVSVYGVASVAGPLIGGILTDQASWRWCFYINLPCGAVTALLVVFCVRSQPVPQTDRQGGLWSRFQQLDLPGNLVFTSFAICLLLALEWGGSKYPWSEPRIIALLLVSGALFLVFLAIQHWQKDNATVPIDLIKRRCVWGSVLFSLCIPGIFSVFTYYLPIWFQSVKNATATLSGVMNIPLLLGTVIVGVLISLALTRFRCFAPFLLGSSVVLSVGSGLMTTLDVNAGHPKWIGYQALVGIGLGLGQQLPVVIVSTLLDPVDIPTGTVLITFVQLLSGAIFVSVAQNIFQGQLVSSLQVNGSGSEIDVRQVLALGINGFRQHYSGDELGIIVQSYNDAVTRVFYVPVGLSVLSVVTAGIIGWGRARNN